MIKTFKIRKATLSGLLLLLIVTYPVSPVLYQFFIYNTAWAYSAFLVGFVIICVSLKNEFKSNINDINVDRLWRLHCILLVSIATTLLITRNLVAARDFITLSALLYACKYLTHKSFVNLFRAVIYWVAIFTFISICTTSIFYFSEYLYGASDNSWQVPELNLADGSPVLLRHEYGDYDYRMPFYLSLIPKNIYSSDFPRLPLFFTEPSYYAWVTLPLLFITIVDKAVRFRRPILVIFCTGILVCQSVLGTILLALVPSGYYIFSLLFRKGVNNLFFSLVILVTGYLLFSNLELLFLIAKTFSAQTALNLQEALSNLDSFQLTPFGHVLDQQDDYIRLGAGVVLARYGYVGAFLFMCIVLQLLLCANSLAKNTLDTKFNRICIFSSVAVSALFGFKVPFVILAIPLLSTFYFMAYQTEFNHAKKKI